jgi:hypothetical protein
MQLNYMSQLLLQVNVVTRLCPVHRTGTEATYVLLVGLEPRLIRQLGLPPFQLIGRKTTLPVIWKPGTTSVSE